MTVFFFSEKSWGNAEKKIYTGFGLSGPTKIKFFKIRNFLDLLLGQEKVDRKLGKPMPKPQNVENLRNVSGLKAC